MRTSKFRNLVADEFGSYAHTHGEIGLCLTCLPKSGAFDRVDSPKQIVKIVREADKAPVTDVARKHAISDETLYSWRD